MFPVPIATLSRALVFTVCTITPTFSFCFDEPPAVVIRVDEAKQVTVTPLDRAEVHLPEGESGIVLWSEDGRERWQVFSGRWKKPPGMPLQTVERAVNTRVRGGQRARISPRLAKTTKLFTQLRSPPINRDFGSMMTPYDGARLLNARLTFRRTAADAGEVLPKANATVFADDAPLLRIQFPEDTTVVRWETLEEIPAELKQGLRPGSYRLEMGKDRIRFKVLDDAKRKAVTEHAKELAALLDDELHPLVLQVSAEQMLLAGEPHLADALDVLDQVPEENLSEHLLALKRHVRSRLIDPKASHEFRRSTGDKTEDELIDDIRSLIATSRWEEAFEEIEAVLEEDHPVRRIALAHLYRGVVLSEGGSGREGEARSAFTTAITRLEELNNRQDLYRAHNNFANFLLGRMLDRLHNHAFQMAAGVRAPLLNSLRDWATAASHFRSASMYANDLSDKIAVALNEARMYLALGDLLDSLAPASSPAVAARQVARERAQRALAAPLDVDRSLTRALAFEVLSQAAYRADNTSEAIRLANKALQLFQVSGSLVGVESVYRSLGLYKKSEVDDLLVSERIADVLRARFPVGETGIGLAGFLSRRANAAQVLVDRLLAVHAHEKGLLLVEKAKSRVLLDTLNEGIGPFDNPRDAQSASPLLSRWPSQYVAIEYYFTTEKAWLFCISQDGTVSVTALRDERGEPIAPRTLIAEIQKVQHLLRDYSEAWFEEGVLHKTFDHEWQGQLHSLYNVLIPVHVRKSLFDAEHLIVVPHHVLHYFPFAALVTRQDSARTARETVQPTFLLSQFRSISYAPSLGIWSQLRIVNENPTHAGVLADTSPEADLENVKAEVAALRESFGSKANFVRVGEQATVDAALELLAGQRLAFFACHGKNDWTAPLNGRLELSDGHLTAREVFRTDVRAPIVVLGACQTALAAQSPSPGDDLFGIERAFLHRGARAVISGMWDVDDKRGSRVTTSFIKKFSKGEPAATALCDAQREIMNLYRGASDERLRFFAHPHFWAVYRLNGADNISFQE